MVAKEYPDTVTEYSAKPENAIGMLFSELGALRSMYENQNSEHWSTCHSYVKRVVDHLFIQDPRTDKLREYRQDIVQNVMLQLIQDLPKFRGECRLSTWIYTSARWKTLEALRDLKKPILLPLDTPSKADYTFEQKTVLRLTLDEAFQKAVMSCSSHIDSKRDTKILEMSFYAGFTNREIAQITGTSLSAVNNVVTKGRQVVRKMGIEHFLMDLSRAQLIWGNYFGNYCLKSQERTFQYLVELNATDSEA